MANGAWAVARLATDAEVSWAVVPMCGTDAAAVVLTINNATHVIYVNAATPAKATATYPLIATHDATRRAVQLRTAPTAAWHLVITMIY